MLILASSHQLRFGKRIPWLHGNPLRPRIHLDHPTLQLLLGSMLPQRHQDSSVLGLYQAPLSLQPHLGQVLTLLHYGFPLLWLRLVPPSLWLCRTPPSLQRCLSQGSLQLHPSLPSPPRSCELSVPPWPSRSLVSPRVSMMALRTSAPWAPRSLDSTVGLLPGWTLGPCLASPSILSSQVFPSGTFSSVLPFSSPSSAS